MIETELPLSQNKKSKILMRKKCDQTDDAFKCGYLFRESSSEGQNAPNSSVEQDPIKIFVKDVFCYRNIKSVVKNQHFICLKLKETRNQKLSIRDHIKRFKTSNLKFYQNFGQYLEIFDNLLKEKTMNLSSKQNIYEIKSTFQKQLQQVLEQKKNTKCVIFYYQPSQKLLNFSQILVSNIFLRELGYDPIQFCDEFLKYKHLFFQIMQTSLFEKAIFFLAELYNQFAEQNPQIKSMAADEINELMKKKMRNEIRFSDFVLKRIKDSSGTILQKLAANFCYLKYKPNITLVELQSFDQENVLEIYKKKPSFFENKIKKTEEQKIEKEIKVMKNLMYKIFASDDEQKPSQNQENENITQYDPIKQ